jgi:hypothetical protein
VASTIGIKIANGEFYSIIDENSRIKKRLVLTTVHDSQQSVQIDLYRSAASTMADASYIGSLVLENIEKRPKGEPSIELVIASDSNGNITADAIDLDASGERQTLNVSIKSMDEDNLGADIPDFEIDNYEGPPDGLYEKPEEIIKEKEKKGFPWLVVILAALVLTAIALLLWLFFFQGKNYVSALTGPAAPVSQSRPADPAPAAQPAQTAPQSEPQVTQSPAAPAQSSAPAVQSTPPPVIQAPAQVTVTTASATRQRAPAPVASYNVPSVIPREGVSYRVRYGDTLWDIADAFYRNPWLYPRIARFNNIRNPDHIISGTTIIVPPRN